MVYLMFAAVFIAVKAIMADVNDDDDFYNNRVRRSPSPGHPMQQGYQLDDRPYGRPEQLDYPQTGPSPGSVPGRYGTPSDQLQLNAAQSVDNLSRNSPFADPHQRGPYQTDYAVNPEAHHDAYYNQPYEPTPMEGTPLGYDPGQPGYDHDDLRPMLPHQDSHASEPYQDQPTPQGAGGGIKRWKTVKQVLLYRGNLVLDCPVPPRLLNQLPHGERDEFTHMRYSAATCDPDHFYDENFTLRQRLFSKPRHTELFIVVTMYNEDEILFARSMIGVFKNIEYMCNRKESKTWGKDAWKKIVVCVVSDGRSKINSRTRALLAGMGVYQEGIAKQQVNGKDVTSHIYEYTTQIKAMLGTGGKNLLNPLIATQNFEYKMSNILDKPLESAFGFISVLPGAFSAYRYVALQNDKNGQGPLEKYFAGETLHGSDAGIFESNMYLAEDRILCFELVTKRNCHWILQYVKSATGETDVPDTVTELVLQRRRWLNGSFFAAIYAIAHFYQFFRSDHSFLRKVMLFIEFIFHTINMVFAWFAVGNFFLDR
ncbi:hypothetical protein BN1723_002387 [Verticillium longisporum]|uniref:Chitin synthase n=1 Tax=Verticillium longisporum TaxID=100787 RepID=A0A0G4L658_VERLO|nr:hypothetical protein BN1723_002387 [Verticillium longisporum]